MNRVPVTDAADPRLSDYVALRDTSLRKSLESERGLFIAEGEKVIRRAIEAGHRPRSFLLAERWIPGLADLIDLHPDAPVYVVSEDLAEAVTGFHVHRGALASLHRAEPTPMADLLGLRRLVVAEDIVDHTNVGAILRNAAGLGWDGVLLAPRAADPLYRRSIKVSMGTVFSLPWARVDDWATAIPSLRAAGFTVVALALTRTPSAWTTSWPRACPTSWRSWSAPRGRGCRAAGSSRRTPWSRSPWPTGSTRSTSPPPRPWRAGRCAEARFGRAQSSSANFFLGVTGQSSG